MLVVKVVSSQREQKSLSMEDEKSAFLGSIAKQPQVKIR
jgi:hypothetical protein